MGPVEQNRGASAVAAVLLVASLVVFDPGGWLAFAPIKWAIVTVGTAILVMSIKVWDFDRRSAYGWAAFLGLGVLASLSAEDPLYTWFGTPDRHLGLLAWAAFALLFLAGQSIATDHGIRVIQRAAVVAGILVAFVAGLESVGSPLIELTTNSSRLGGPFGSPAYLGAALCLLIPLSLSALADPGHSGGWRIAAGLSAASCVAVAVGTQTRAAWVGLAVAAAFTAPSWRRWVTRRKVLATALGLVFVALILLSPLSNRLADAVTGNATQARVDEWRTGVTAIAAAPWLGSGFEGYRIVFPSVVDADYARAYGRSVIPDRAHNGASMSESPRV